jgi:hypothetical protein
MLPTLAVSSAGFACENRYRTCIYTCAWAHAQCFICVFRIGRPDVVGCLDVLDVLVLRILLGDLGVWMGKGGCWINGGVRNKCMDGKMTIQSLFSMLYREYARNDSAKHFCNAISLIPSPGSQADSPSSPRLASSPPQHRDRQVHCLHFRFRSHCPCPEQ